MSARPSSSLRRARRSLGGLALALLCALPAVAHAAPPANDDFAAAQAVALPGQVTGSNVDATLEANEPATSGEHIGRSVWYRFTPQTTQRVRIDTCRSDVHTELAVYTGDSVGALTELAHSGFECSRGGRVYLDAVAATTYRIRVVGTVGATGAIALALARPQAPSNDDFAAAQPLPIPARVTGSNVDATLEAGEPEPSPYTSGHSVWYRLTAATGAPVRISTCGVGSNSLLAVYTGTSVTGLTEVGRDVGICGFRTMIDVAPAPGATYYVAVRGNGHTADDFTLEVSAATSPPPPPLPPPLLPPPLLLFRGGVPSEM